jgi:hypothetical protein
MKLINSRYTFWGVGLLVGLNIGWGFITFIVFTHKKIFAAETWGSIGTIAALLFILAMQVLFLILLATQSPRVIIDDKNIKFLSPLLPFWVSNYKWSDFDFYYTVEEQSRGGTYEAIWLVKNGKLKRRISSFYYSNYELLKEDIALPYQGRLSINPFKQLYCLLGGSL